MKSGPRDEEKKRTKSGASTDFRGRLEHHEDVQDGAEDVRQRDEPRRDTPVYPLPLAEELLGQQDVRGDVDVEEHQTDQNQHEVVPVEHEVPVRLGIR